VKRVHCLLLQVGEVLEQDREPAELLELVLPACGGSRGLGVSGHQARLSDALVWGETTRTKSRAVGSASWPAPR
jgi:hypothetical protein